MVGLPALFVFLCTVSLALLHRTALCHAAPSPWLSPVGPLPRVVNWVGVPGSDTAECGTTPLAPCASMAHVLQRHLASRAWAVPLDILLGPGHYGLESCGLVAHQPVNITGAGKGATFVDCGGTMRLVEAHSSCALAGFTVSGGFASVDVDGAREGAREEGPGAVAVASGGGGGAVLVDWDWESGTPLGLPRLWGWPLWATPWLQPSTARAAGQRWWLWWVVVGCLWLGVGPAASSVWRSVILLATQWRCRRPLTQPLAAAPCASPSACPAWLPTAATPVRPCPTVGPRSALQASTGLRTLGGDVQNGSLVVDGLTVLNNSGESNEVGGGQGTAEMCTVCP
jgi:hypothetical protein